MAFQTQSVCPFQTVSLWLSNQLNMSPLHPHTKAKMKNQNLELFMKGKQKTHHDNMTANLCGPTKSLPNPNSPK